MRGRFLVCPIGAPGWSGLIRWAEEYVRDDNDEIKSPIGRDGV